jgi:aminoglycoside phosphotransferase (APT) family kinase protein
VLAIPATWDDVTPAWMSDALGADVADVRVLGRDDGTNRRARLGVRYRSGSGPEVVFAKAEGDHREVHARNGNLFNEADLFASGVPLPVDHPHSYRVIVDRPRLDHLILMEDVTGRGGDPRDATRPMTPAQVEAGVRGLARLHDRYWGLSATTPELGWVQTWAPTAGWQVGLRRRVPPGIERATESLAPGIAGWAGDEVVDLWARFVATLTRGPVTLLHGDAHIGNTYVLPDHGVGFLDWQVVRRGNWSQDVGYFLVGALTVEDRRRNDRRVLDAYVDELGRVDADEAWLRYRASAVYGLAIWLSTLGTDGYQSREVSLALAERYAVACADLDAADALAELERRLA